jgi:hypothetical protein
VRRRPASALRPVLIAITLLHLTCAGSWRRDPLLDPQRASDIVGLHEVWTGAPRACLPVPKSDAVTGTQPAQQWSCPVPRWSSVLLTIVPGAPATRELVAQTDRTWGCTLERFSRDAVVVDRMEGQIISSVTAALESGPFEGACLALDHWYDRRECDVHLFLPDRPREPSGPPRAKATGRERCRAF